jgi:hypothetical protein
LGEVYALSRSTPRRTSTPQDTNLLSSPTGNLLTPRRMDLAVKWRFFSHLLYGGDQEAERVYRWHIAERSGHRMNVGMATDQWKRSLDDYVEAAQALCASLSAHQFMTCFAVPVDPTGELLDGSHRVACSLALRIPEIPVAVQPRSAWAPAWDVEWFKGHHMPLDDFDRMMSDWETMLES